MENNIDDYQIHFLSEEGIKLTPLKFRLPRKLKKYYLRKLGIRFLKSNNS